MLYNSTNTLCIHHSYAAVHVTQRMERKMSIGIILKGRSRVGGKSGRQVNVPGVHPRPRTVAVSKVYAVEAADRFDWFEAIVRRRAGAPGVRAHHTLVLCDSAVVHRPDRRARRRRRRPRPPAAQFRAGSHRHLTTLDRAPRTTLGTVPAPGFAVLTTFVGGTEFPKVPVGPAYRI